VDWQHVAWSAAVALVEDGKLKPAQLQEWRDELNIDAAKPDPLYS